MTTTDYEHYWKFDEEEGNTAKDEKESAPITINDQADWEPGQYGNSLRFSPNGTRQASISLPDRKPPWTISMWVQRQAHENKGAVLLSSDEFAIKLEQWGGEQLVGITKYWKDDLDHFDLSSGYKAPAKTWAHLALVGTNEDTKLYADGEHKYTFDKAINLPLSWVGSGEKRVEDGAFLLDELKIFYRALEAEEVTELFNDTSGPTLQNVWVWGLNDWSQVDSRSDAFVSRPAKVSGLPKLKAIAGGGWFSVALGEDGIVWVWGANDWGQLGSGSNNPVKSPTPSKVTFPNPAKAQKISAGGWFSAALLEDGTLWSWGAHDLGQLGDGTPPGGFKSPVKVLIPDGFTVKEIASGGWHGLALSEDGRVCAWGRNDFGQLGNSNAPPNSKPVPVNIPSDSKVKAIAAGALYSMALLEDGTAYAWGRNDYGQLGNGKPGDPQRSPVPVVPPGNGKVKIKAIAPCVIQNDTECYSMALLEDGTVWAWGCNNWGQLGDGTTTNSVTPIQAQILTDVQAIAAAGWHNIALRKDGTVWTWGRDVYGQYGNGIIIPTAQGNMPVQVSLLSGIKAITAGGHHCMVAG